MNRTARIGEILRALLVKEEGNHAFIFCVIGIACFVLLLVVLGKKSRLEKALLQDDFEPLYGKIQKQLTDYGKALGLLAVGSVIFWGGGLGSIWFFLLDYQYIVISEGTDALVRGFSALIFGIMILVAGYLYKTNFFKTRELKDGYIEGTVVGTHREQVNPLDMTEQSINLLPWQKKLVVTYIDPYDNKEHIYKLSRPRNIIKYPIGSAYQLSYSADERRAYDANSEKANSYMMLTFYFLGGICVVAGIMWLMRGI